MIRVLLVDDQPLVRKGLVMVLQPVEGIEVVGEAADGVEAVEGVGRLLPDVVVMDVRMPRLDGIEATKLIVRRHPASRVLVLTTFDVDEHVYGALRAGASGFLLKDAPVEQFVDAIRVVHSGASMWAAEATRRIVTHFTGAGQGDAAELIRRSGLTPREVEVLRHMARGLSNAQIGEELFVSDATVKTPVARVLAKLDARSRTHAVVMAFEAGLARKG
ncbi:response regulator transcription factor [Ammonicoccus fulvus]|uniref:Response regulator transcription factor n=1 Tax=Ammonicoccus fulvus TaxID=3138240 RepID=A0ABZ3FSN7_9ACTN